MKAAEFREKAEQARRLVRLIGDREASAALRTFIAECEMRAVELEADSLREASTAVAHPHPEPKPGSG